MPMKPMPGECGEQIAGVGDGRVGQHALDVLLAERGEIADGHGEDGNDPEQRRPDGAEIGEHLIDHAEKQSEGGGFGRGREQGDDRRGRAFVDVGRPDVERRCGNLEENADQHEREGGENERLVLRDGGESRDLIDLRGAGGAEDQGNAVEQKRGGKGAEEEVLDGGFRAAAGLLPVAGEDVRGDGRDFEGDEDHEQLDGAGEQAHADGAEYDERVNSPWWWLCSGSVSSESRRATRTMPQMRTWKKTVKALVSTVPKKPVPSGSASCQRLAQSAMVVPMAATQPSGRRGQEGGIEASSTMMATPVRVRITSGRMR